MIMKKLFLLIMLLMGMHAYSQNYYTRETIEGTHATYFSLSWLADGYNIIANSQSYSRLNTSALYKDGTPVYPDSYKCVRSSDPNGSILMSIVKSALPADKLNELKNSNESLLVLLVIEPDGSIAELGFILSKNSLQRSIPVDTFFEMEKQIKAKIRFIPDDKTKNIYRWFHESVSIKFKDIK